jgi:hypothetical protein
MHDPKVVLITVDLNKSEFETFIAEFNITLLINASNFAKIINMAED